MKKSSRLQHLLVMVLVLASILLPRPLAGFFDLASASRFEANEDYKTASAAYASAATRIPWRPALWEQAGLMAWQAGDSANAILFLEKARGLGAISGSGWIILGAALLQQDDIPGAVSTLEQALPSAEASALLADAYQRSGDFDRARKAWQEAVEQAPGNAVYHYRLGLLLMTISATEALPELLQAARLEEQLDPTVQGLRTALNKAALAGERSMQLLGAGQALAALGEWNLARHAFRQSVEQRPDYAEAWAWLAEAEQQLGDDGSPELERALACNPGSATVQGLYGAALQRQGKPEAALAAFQKAAELEPDNPAWQIALGSAMESLGNLVAAREYYLGAVELAPGDAASWRALVTFSLANLVDVDTIGLPGALKLLELAPDDWRSHDLAGQAAFLLENYPGAESYLNKAIQLAPTEAAPALHLGLVYLATNRRSQAFSYLSLATTFDPQGSFGWQARRLLEQYFP